MADDPTLHASEQEPSASEHQPTNIEALQDLKAREGTQAFKEQALRQLLTALDPHPQDAKLTYRQVLERLENVLARELQATKEEE